jgi:hypothetical protein
MDCSCCGCPKDACKCSSGGAWKSGIPLLAHIPCLLAAVLPLLGVGASLAGGIHSLAPVLFLVSLACIAWSLSRWKRLTRRNRIVSVAIALVVLALWYPHRAHVVPWGSPDQAGEHCH